MQLLRVDNVVRATLTHKSPYAALGEPVLCCEDCPRFIMPIRSFRIHPDDNVATLLDDAAAGATVELLGSTPDAPLVAAEPISLGHKVALRDFAVGEVVTKFGVRIGHATRPIARGQWVHLHNLASDFDERSATLDLHTGAATDTKYE
jgi:hypothetical protein